METTMTVQEAKNLLSERETQLRGLRRLPTVQLTRLMDNDGSLLFGSFSRDERITHILTARGYGVDRVNECTHVLYHDNTGIWSACAYCHASKHVHTDGTVMDVCNCGEQ